MRHSTQTVHPESALEAGREVSGVTQQDGHVATEEPTEISVSGLRQASKTRNEKPKHAFEFAMTQRGYHHGQSDLTLWAKVDGVAAGRLEFSDHQGDISIQWLKAHEGWGRQGVGTALMHALQRRYPGVEIHLGGSTTDGTALLKSLSFREIPSEHAEAFVALAKAKAEEARLQEVANAFFALTEPPTAEARKAFDVEMAKFNDVNDDVFTLEQATWDKSPVKRLLVLPEETATTAATTEEIP